MNIRIGWESLALTYDTTRYLPAGAAMQPQFPKPNFLPELWESNLHRRIVPGHQQKSIYALRGSHTIVTFTGDGQGIYTAEADTNDRLVVLKNGTTLTGYQYHDTAGRAVESYDANGYLTRIDRHDGDFLIFTNSTAATAVAPGPGYVLSIQDAKGRSVQFEYLITTNGMNGFITKIVDTAGRPIVLSYDGNPPRLRKIVWQDQEVTPEEQRPYRWFIYDDPTVTWGVSGIEDENRARHATITYDSRGRATASELAGGVDRHSVTYTLPPEIQIEDSAPVLEGSIEYIYRTRTFKLPAGTVVTSPNGSTSTWTAESRNGGPALLSKNQPAGAGCAESTSRQTYDDNGNVASRDDFNAHRECFAYDAANRETVRVEGLANTAACSGVLTSGSALPSGTRKTSTEWHPSWRLPTRVAEPLKRVTSIYNGQPDPFNGNAPASCVTAATPPTLPDGQPLAVLCKQVEQATSDADGSQGFSAAIVSAVPARVWQWTYNASGQVLTERGPRADLDDTTVYTYYTDTSTDHRIGDLASVKPPLLPATQYTKYNAAGQVLQSIDANGVTTAYEYDARQRLLSTTTTTPSGNVKTAYEWYPTGLLKKITAPDQSFLLYGYDDAHRLTSVSDHLGNSVTYTLDASGNRVAEQVKDPGSLLKRQLGRAFDALNRVQRLTPGATQ